MFLPLFVAAVAFGAVCDAADIYFSEKCFKELGAVETNTWLVGTRPTVLDYLKRDVWLYAVICAPALAASFVNPPLALGLLAAPVAFGARHIQGAVAGVKLLKKFKKPIL